MGRPSYRRMLEEGRNRADVCPGCDVCPECGGKWLAARRCAECGLVDRYAEEDE